jgi:glutamate-1-semialdehyde 2,1-aminomutase
MSKTHSLYKKAKTIIPGGVQLLSKRPELHLPDQWPEYCEKAKGCEIWDMNGNQFIDMSYMGIGTCTIGYADDDVDNAVIDGLRRGNMSTLNAPEEVELAELLCDLHPWADMARFTRTGGEAIAVAIRIARAYSGRDIILFGGYHGWHDWYLAANIEDRSNLSRVHLAGLKPSGVPKALKGTSHPFFYNDTDSFIKLIEKHKDKVGAVIIESVRNLDPTPEFVDAINTLTRKYNIPFIVDEVSAGFRMTLGGGHLLYGMTPDIAVFAKGMSNGYPMAAVIGKRAVMEAAQTSFISSTYWTDRIGPIAALATIQKMEKKNINQHLVKMGKRIKSIWRQAAKKYDLDIMVGGMDPIAHFSFLGDLQLELKTLFTQEMLKKGFLATNSFYASYAHKREHIKAYEVATDSVFEMLALSLKKGNTVGLLEGPVCHSGFQRLT